MADPRLLCALALVSLAARPDEGQWLPQQVLEMDWAQLQARGMQLTKDQFWHPTEGGVLSAAVQISGCSAGFVSAEGLLATNHHCGFAAIQQNSTVERNLVRDGYVAATRADELRAPGMTVSIVRRIEDVSAKVLAAREQAKDDTERALVTDRTIKALIAEGEKEPDTKCDIATFFEGRTYHLYHRTQLKDVRLVYAPPRAIGEFGGEDDNWEWPRHTGDFTFFRAYVGKDGKPAAYAPDNVPFHPKHFLKVSSSGVQEGDLVLVLGYPGRTERYLSSLAVAERQGYFWPKRHELYTRYIEILEAAGRGDERKALALSTRIKSLANVQKASDGQVKGLTRNRTVERKLREEQTFTAWVDGDAERKAKWGTALADLIALDTTARATQERDLVIAELARQTPFFSSLVDHFAMTQGGKTASRYSPPKPPADFAIVEQRILALLLDEARRLTGAQAFRGLEAFTGSQAPTDAILAGIVKTSALWNADAKSEGGDDPFLAIARGVAQTRLAAQAEARALQGRRLVVGPRWIEAQEAWRGRGFYPDANSTLRVSVATVRGYQPRDGATYQARTRVAGLLEKESGKEPFANPKALLAAAEKRMQSPYVDSKLGDVPVCFLADADTTGGNSGSPIVNGKGELVGLNFDRVFENVAGDYGWNAERSRNVGVEVRYLRWVMTDVLPAPHLLEELGK